MNVYLVGMGIKINHNFNAAGVILWQKQENQLEYQSYFQFFWTHLRP